MTDPAPVTTILTTHYKPCFPTKNSSSLSDMFLIHCFIFVRYRGFIAEFWILHLRHFFFQIADILHINCLILQKLYSVVLVSSLMSLTLWYLSCAWLSGWDKCNPGYSSAVPTLVRHALCCLRKHWKQIFGSHPQISAVFALWMPQNSDFSESSHHVQNSRGWDVLPAQCNLAAGSVIELKESCRWTIVKKKKSLVLNIFYILFNIHNQLLLS